MMDHLGASAPASVDVYRDVAMPFFEVIENARRHILGCHRPPPGLACGEPDDRLQRAIQYSETFAMNPRSRGVLDTRCAGMTVRCEKSDQGSSGGLRLVVRPRFWWQRATDVACLANATTTPTPR